MLIVPEFYTDLAGLAILLAVVARQVVRARSEREGRTENRSSGSMSAARSHPEGTP
jgi:UPF0716 family protein affecting phage T7 exclusion